MMALSGLSFGVAGALLAGGTYCLISKKPPTPPTYSPPIPPYNGDNADDVD